MTLWLYKQQSGIFSNINCCPSKWRRIVCVCVCVLDKAAIFKLDLDLENFPSKQTVARFAEDSQEASRIYCNWRFLSKHILKEVCPRINSACFWSLVGVSWPGYINKPHNKQGTDLQVVVRGKRYPAKVWVSQSKKHEA